MKYFNTPNVEKYPFLKNELLEYFTIDAGYFGVPVDYALDNYYFFNKYQHKPWAYFRNGYADSPNSEWFPVVISRTPYIPFKYELSLKGEDIDKIYNFVKLNNSNLLKITYTGDISLLKDVSKIYEEKIEKIYEMSILYPKDTGLPMKIWIDNFGASPQHSKYRIKFKSEINDKDSMSWPTMILDDEKTIIGDYKLNKKDMNKLMTFVDENSGIIKSAIDQNWSGMRLTAELILAKKKEKINQNNKK